MRKAPVWILSLALLAAALPLAAQYGDPAPYAADDIRQSVARIAYVTGDVSYNRGDDPDAWDTAAINFPMTLGDRIWAARDGRVELQARGANVYVASETELAALNLTEDVQQYSLTTGTLTVRLHRLDPDDAFEVDTPNAAVTFERAGDYRIDVDQDGNTRVTVRRGRAWVAAGGGQVPLDAGDQMAVDGLDSPTYDVFAATRPDGWDRWVDSRSRRYRESRWTASVNADIIGGQDLDAYGTWQDLPGYGACWRPASVYAGWTPYRDGRWVWQDPWGWSWVSTEPWGFAPYHYGRWVSARSAWYWVPGAPRVHVRYAPALVAFVGGGPGWSASFAVGGGSSYVGWFPLGPADPLIPWWGASHGYGSAHVTYVNRSYVTVVQQNVFVSGGWVNRNAVRDMRVVRNIATEPILRGPLPLVPTRSAIRVSVDAGRGIRPPAPLAERAVVTRLAPPPAPPMFAAKVDVIRENRGAPVSPVAASRLSIERHDGARAVVPVRPVAEERVVLTPRRGDASMARPVAVTAPTGKVLATRERPFVGAPAAVSGRAEGVTPPPPARGAVVGRDEARPPVRVERGATQERVDARDRGAEQAPQREAPPARATERPTPAPRGDREAPPPARGQYVPPAREPQAAPPARETARDRVDQAPPAQREAPPQRAFERPTPVPREERAAPPQREVPPQREAPPQRAYERPTPAPREERAAPPPLVRRETARERVDQAPPVQREAPPQRAEPQRPAPPPREERAAPPAPPRQERVAPPREERKAPPPSQQQKEKDEKEKKREQKERQG